MQLNHANFIFFLVCRQIFESLIENWNIIWPQYFKRNCSSDSLKILSDEFMQEPPRWGLWSGDYAYVDSSRIYMYLSGTLGLHTLFFFLPETLLTASNCRLLSHLRTRRGVACLAHLPVFGLSKWLTGD